MSFTIPNLASAAFAVQAQVDKVDLDIIVAGAQNTGVVSGCAVTSTGAANGSVAVAVGSIRVADAIKAVPALTPLAVTANASGNPRLDLVTCPVSTGVPVVTAGTAAAAPVFPSVPAGSVCLAAVYVANGHTSGTTLAANTITDKRMSVPIYLDRRATRGQYVLEQDTSGLTTLCVKGKSGAASWPLFEVDDYNDAPIFAIGNAGGATCNDFIQTAYTIVGPFLFAADIYGFLWRGKQCSFAYNGPPGNMMLWIDACHEVFEGSRVASTGQWGVVTGCTLGIQDLGAPPTGSPTGYRSALKLTNTTAGTEWISQLGGASALSGFVAGEVVSGVAWLRSGTAAAGRTANLRFTYYNAGGTVVGSDVNGTGVSIPNTGVWTKITIDNAIIPATVTRVNVQILLASVALGEIHHVCGVGIMRGQKAGVFGPPFVAQTSTGGPATAETGAVAGDRWSRTDTPTTPGQREYVCLVGGAPNAQTWGGLDASSISRVGTDIVNSTVTMASITELALPVAANQAYMVDYVIAHVSALATTGIQFAFTGPASPTSFVAVAEMQQTATTFQTATLQAYGSFTAGAASIATPSLNYNRIKVMMVNGATAGTLQVQFASEVAASAVTVKVGSALQAT
jgi:hypothetical protein